MASFCFPPDIKITPVSRRMESPMPFSPTTPTSPSQAMDADDSGQIRTPLLTPASPMDCCGDARYSAPVSPMEFIEPSTEGANSCLSVSEQTTNSKMANSFLSETGSSTETCLSVPRLVMNEGVDVCMAKARPQSVLPKDSLKSSMVLYLTKTVDVISGFTSTEVSVTENVSSDISQSPTTHVCRRVSITKTTTPTDSLETGLSDALAALSAITTTATTAPASTSLAVVSNSARLEEMAHGLHNT